MGEYATFTIWRKLEKEKSPKNEIYHNLFEVKDNGLKTSDYLASIGKNLLEFGTVAFRKEKGQIYYSHVPFGYDAQFHQQVCKYNILPEWLLCYTYVEMKVTGKEVGLFRAETTAGEAKKRIDSLDLEKAGADWQFKRYELYCWLGVHANPDDILTLSSDLIYYSPDGEFNEEYVKKDINKKIKSIREKIAVPYWKKCS